MELPFHFKRRDNRWRPYLIGGTGAKGVHRRRSRAVPSTGSSNRKPHNQRRWKVVFSVGGGLKFRLMPRMLLGAEFLDYLPTFPRQQIVPALHNTARGVFQQFTPLCGISYTF